MDFSFENYLFLEKGEQKKYWKIDQEKKKITYFLKSNKTYKITDPEELVRAEFFMELIEKYQYESTDIEFEREMPQRVPNFYADIVVNKKGTDDPFLVIECKRVDITDSEFEQSVKQGAGNARVLAGEYFGAVAGESRRFFLTKNFSEKNPLEKAESDCPVKYNKPEEWRFKKGDKEWDLTSATQESLKSLLKKCHQTLWAGGKRDAILAFGEMAKIIFIKIWDEKETNKGTFYEFQRKSNESTSSLKKRVDNLYIKAKNDDPEVFDNEIQMNEGEISTIIEHLQKFSFLRTDVDIKGLGFQQFVGNFFKGEYGAFFTPSPMVRFCVDLFSCEIRNTHKILDPACGSGGFLLEALNDMRRKSDEKFGENPQDPFEIAEKKTFWNDFAKHNLFGIEISSSISKLAKMNMLLHEDGKTNVIQDDGLEDFQKYQLKNLEFKKENFDYIFTNPPFGATIRGSEKSYLGDYELASKTNASGKTTKMKNQKTEILFLERCWQFLKVGGKMAVVLPDGILTNSSLQYVRDWILDHFKLLGVVSLPQDAFRYYGAGVKSSILILEKGKFSEDYPIFMAQPEKIGIDSTGRPCENDLDEVVKNFWEFHEDPKGFQKKKSKNIEWIFSVLRSEIEGRFDVETFSLEAFSLEYKNLSPISDFAKIQGGYMFSSKKYQESGIPIIRIQNIQDGEVLLDSKIYWDKNYTEDLERFSLYKGDILIAMTGATIGKVGIFASEKPALLNQRVGKFLINEKKINKSYFRHILNSEFFLKQVVKNSLGGAQPNISGKSLESLQIPLPPLEIQKQIAEKMDNAFAVKKEKEQEAEEVLASIEPYLLGELGIEEVEEEKKEMVFCVNRESIGKRFDTFFHNPEFQKIENNLENSKFKTKSLKNFLSKIRYGLSIKNTYAETGTPFLRILNLKRNEIDTSKVVNLDDSLSDEIGNCTVQKDDFLISRSGSIGIVARVKKNAENFAFGSFMISFSIAEEKKSEIDLNFLEYFLNSSIAQKYFERNKIGAIQGNITIDTIQDIQIPFPEDIKIQQKISAEIFARREKGKKLREEAEEILEVAKREVESVILGG